MKFTIYAFTAFFLLFLLLPSTAKAQRRDYLTDQELDIVSDAQEIDLRVASLVKAAERRFYVLNNDAAQTKQIEKDKGAWGELPKGTRAELELDIAQILQKAIDDIDNLATRKGGMESELFPKAMHNLAAAARRFQPQLKTELEKAEDKKERGSILTSIDLCAQIIDAETRVKEVKKK
jgi:acyl-CoA reductase-like NAD-dependent aldehyde dehydrogenase